MTKNILVPLDGSSFGEQALPTALGLARSMDTAIELVLVQEPLEIPETIKLSAARDPRIRQELRAAGASYLEMIAGRLRAEGRVEVIETLLEGPVEETLASYIAEQGAEMVVMSTHGRGGISRAWLGSVADALVRRLDVPVMLHRPSDSVVQRAGATPLNVARTFERIVVPLDGSAMAEEALDHAVAMVRASRVELTLLQVLPPPVTYLRPTFTADVSVELLEELEQDAHRYLDRIAGRLQRPGLTVRTRVLVDANAARGILAFTTGGSEDLIVMTTHARRGVARLVIGSVADKVVRGSTVPVMLIRPRAMAQGDVLESAAVAEASSGWVLPPI